MKQVIYSEHHRGIVEYPLLTKPNENDFIVEDSYDQVTFDGATYYELLEAYNTWLSSPPIYKVRPEDIEWFSVERGEDEFEVIDSHKWFLSECEDCGWQGSSEKLLGGGALADTGDYGDCYCPKCESRKVEEVNTFPSYEGLVAIPKKRNESKEQRPSVEQGYSEAFWKELEEKFRDHAKEHLHFTECDGRYKAGYSDAVDFSFEWFKSSLPQRGYSEAEVKELLRQQREKCARAYLDNFKNHGILNAPEPQLKSSVT
jgi:hypothetical protein